MFKTHTRVLKKPKNIYGVFNCANRDEYLLWLSAECLFSHELVCTIANILGELEDFDKLPAIILAIKERVS